MRFIAPFIFVLCLGCAQVASPSAPKTVSTPIRALLSIQSQAQPLVTIGPAPAASIAFLPVSVNLEWEDNGEAASFNVYYGPDSRAYLNSINVGANLATTISGLAPLQTYYFAVTAVDASGIESDFSNEFVATPQPQLIRLHFPEANIVGIQSSPDLVNWADRPDAMQTNGDWYIAWQ